MGHGHRVARGTGVCWPGLGLWRWRWIWRLEGHEIGAERAQGVCSGREKRDLKPRIEGK